MENYLRRNIRLLYAFRFLRSFMVIIAVIVPFFQERGLSQTEIYLVQSLFAVSVFLFEVPSGYFADRVGRKKSLVIGSFLFVIGFSYYVFATSFVAIAAAEFFLGIAYTFISGADEALAYESLKALHEENRYKVFEARSQSLTSVSEAAASVLGGLLALVSLRTPMITEAGVHFVMIPVALLLVEPPHVRRSDVHPLRDIARITKYALHDHAEVKWFIFYGAFIATVSHTMVWLIQPYYKLAGVPLGWFGVLWAGQMLAVAWFSHLAVRYERRLGKRAALVSFPIVGVLAYIIMGVFPPEYALAGVLAFAFIRGVQTPIMKHYVNELIESDVRATVMSVKNLAQKALYAGLGPLIGVVVDAYSLQTGLLFSAVLYGVMGIVVLGAMKRRGMV